MNPHKENRVGKFFIAFKCIEDNWDLSNLFKRVIIVKAEFLFHKNGIEYIAYSDLFDVSPIGVEEPHYKLILHGDQLVVKKIDSESAPSYVDKRLAAINGDVSSGCMTQEGGLSSIENI